MKLENLHNVSQNSKIMYSITCCSVCFDEIQMDAMIKMKKYKQEKLSNTRMNFFSTRR